MIVVAECHRVMELETQSMEVAVTMLEVRKRNVGSQEKVGIRVAEC